MAKRRTRKKPVTKAIVVAEVSNQQPRRRRARRVNTMPMLDEPARCWARLLQDPCNSPLCHPVYAGGNGGLLVRASYYSSVTINTGNTGYFFMWTPGILGTSATQTATDTTSFTLGSYGGGYVPGQTFISGNAGSFRVAAACLKVIWAGTELNRQGYMKFGNITASDAGLPGTTTVSLAGLAQLFEAGMRTPDESIDIKWRPTDMDQMTCSPLNFDASSDTGRRGAIGLIISGVPAGASFTLETTAVYEYQPQYNLGITASTQSTSKSVNNMDQVIRALDNSGNWMYKVGSLIGAVGRAATGAYNLYSNPVGVMMGAARRITYNAPMQIGM